MSYPIFNTPELDERSMYLRGLVLRGLIGGGRGHIGSSLSLIEIIRVLYDDFLNFDPKKPLWEERDRFILSKGHGCLAQYAVLADKGFFDLDELDKFCHNDGILGGHPEREIPGVEVSTGALGHGLSIGVGISLAARIKKKEYKTIVVTGDGEINEGSVWEAAMSAAQHSLENLTVMIDYNKNQSYGFTKEIIDLEPMLNKWASFGFGVTEIDGHDVNSIKSCLNSLPIVHGKPNAIICHTVKGKGLDFAENKPEWHHKSNITDEEIEQMNDCLNSKQLKG